MKIEFAPRIRRDVGGDPHAIVTGPDTPFPVGGTFASMNPDINAPRIQSWNVSFERQFGTNWATSVAYLGSYSDRLWGLVEAIQVCSSALRLAH